MILIVELFGHELLRVELTSPAPADEPHPDLVSAPRHGGEFGFGASPARPYWSSDPDEAPPVASPGREPARGGRPSPSAS